MGEGGRSEADLRQAALRLLSLRDHARGELQRKLLARAASPFEVPPVLDWLVAQGLLDDSRFAASFAAARLRRGMGRRRVLEELVLRGVERRLAEEALAGEPPDAEREALLGLARKRADQGRSRAQVARFLMGRGFPAGQVRAALADVFGGGEERGAVEGGFVDTPTPDS